MLTVDQRKLLFLFGCIPTRLALAFIVFKLDLSKWGTLAGLITLGFAIGFGYLWLTNGRKTGFEAGGPIWWMNWRIVHSGLFLITSILLFIHNKHAYVPLLMDALLGTFLHLRHHKYF